MYGIAKDVYVYVYVYVCIKVVVWRNVSVDSIYLVVGVW